MSSEQSPRLTGVRTLHLHAPDPGAARAFYQALTYRHGAPHPGPTAPRAPADATLTVASQRSGPAGWTVGFGVSDLPGALSACAARGARVTEGPADGGRHRVLDPRGIPFELVHTEPSEHPPPGQGDIVLADVYTRDVEAATAFYSSALGLRAEVLPDEPVDYVMLSSYGRHVAGVIDMTSFLDPATSDQWMPYFHFANVDAGIERATALGAWVVVPRTDSPTGDYAVLQDPWGCLFGIWDARSLRHADPVRSASGDGSAAAF
ncbi:VOC family protein [Streptomyces sp. NPDC055078]